MTLQMTGKEMKKISEYKGSPCNTCLVKATCTRSLEDKTVCKDYMDFILKEVTRCVDEAENRFPNKKVFNPLDSSRSY